LEELKESDVGKEWINEREKAEKEAHEFVEKHQQIEAIEKEYEGKCQNRLHMKHLDFVVSEVNFSGFRKHKRWEDDDYSHSVLNVSMDEFGRYYGSSVSRKNSSTKSRRRTEKTRRRISKKPGRKRTATNRS
jgi:hypothetical protein